jgi:hypothetical protein
VVRLHRLGPAQQKKEIPSSKKITTQKKYQNEISDKQNF